MRKRVLLVFESHWPFTILVPVVEEVDDASEVRVECLAQCLGYGFPIGDIVRRKEGRAAERPGDPIQQLAASKPVLRERHQPDWRLVGHWHARWRWRQRRVGCEGSFRCVRNTDDAGGPAFRREVLLLSPPTTTAAGDAAAACCRYSRLLRTMVGRKGGISGKQKSVLLKQKREQVRDRDERARAPAAEPADGGGGGFRMRRRSPQEARRPPHERRRPPQGAAAARQQRCERCRVRVGVR